VAGSDDGEAGGESCAANTVIIASDQPAAYTARIAIDDTHAYWTYGIMIFDAPAFETGSVTRAPLAGGAPTMVASEQRVPAAIALGRTDVFWIDQYAGTIMKAPKTGGAPTGVVSSFNGNILELEADDDSVYWLDYDEGGPGVFKAPVGGGNAIRLATGEGQLEALALDDTHVYWADHVPETGMNRVMKVPIDGGVPTVLHSELFGNADLADLAVGPDGVYWNGAYGEDAESASIKLMRISLAGAAPVTLVDEPGVRHVALNSRYAYWTVELGDGSSGSIRKVPLNGGKVSTVVSDQAGLIAIAVDDANVCWLNFANGPNTGEVACLEACEDAS
jgi:sugar lactone lactonase YvrE